MVLVTALAEPLAHMLGRVGSGLKPCKQRPKCDYHSFFSTSKYEMVEYKTTAKVVFGCFLCVFVFFWI